ncbi:unnamed protein product [Rhizoctonia solani]|uniref:Protein kinase domain-containing protein n=3 Tax=Rhizoctonia solani TaxID=456999 RepID=A0A8H3HMZ5_9AGAM|nr:unnamed protein product [Rhizoctonia solani]CAE6530963.1 unnamed protein product [Rhizoctonia solani]
MQGEGLKLFYLLVDTGSAPVLGSVLVPSSQPPKRMFEIRDLMLNYPDLTKSNYLLYKSDMPMQDYLPDVPAPLGEPLSDIDLISKHWPNGFSPDVFSIIIVIVPKPTGAVLSEPRQNIQAPSVGGHNDDQVQAKVIKAIKKYNTSALAKPSQFNKFQATGIKIFNGRPQEADGLPVGLFHPVFDSFQQRIDSDSFAPTPMQLSATLTLLTASQKIYDTEPVRTEALIPLLQRLLGRHIAEVSIRGTKSDGAIHESNGAYSMIMEIKNEIGTGGCDPSIQGAIAFANYWGQGSFEWLRDQCCCPSMILAIAGPWMCVLGGIMLEHPVIQPLTPFFLVGNNPSSPGHANTVAKIFASLAKALRELQNFYEGFQMYTATLDPTRHLPYIREFSLDGKRVDIEYRKPLVPGKAVFLGVARPKSDESYKVIVKFAESYNAAAHRVLEEINLAPKLIYISSEGPDSFKVAQRIMVVMENAPYDNLTGIPSHPDCVLNDVKRALDALHKRNIVFGDLRPPNVLGVEDSKGRITGAMMIDFDWCGTAGEATYPMDINLTIDWPEGVGPGLPIKPEHDNEMLKRLSKL